MREASKAIRYMVKRAITHVANRHTIFQGEMQSSLLEIVNRLHTISADLHKMAANPTAENVEAMVKHAKKLNRDIDRSQVNLVNIIGREHVSMHSAEMYLGFLQGIRDLANRYVAVAMQERALSQIVNGKTIDRALNNSEMRSHVFGSTTRTGSEAMVISSVEEDDAAEAAKLQVSSDGAAAADAVAQAAAKAAEATVPADHADDHADEAEEKAEQAEARAADQKTDSVSDKPQA